MNELRIGAAALAAVATLALAACDRDTAQRADQEGARIGRQTSQALDTAKQKLSEAGHQLAQAGRKTEQTVDNAVNDASAKSKGASGAGSRLDDAAITASIEADYLKDPDLSVLKIDVDTHDGVVTLNGLAENDAARQRAERIADNVKGVKSVRNFLVVKKA